MRISIGKIIFILIILIPIWSWLWWFFDSTQPMNMLTLDKTVPTDYRNEHRSFNWIQTHYKYVRRDNKELYSNFEDYYGFFPLKPLEDKKYAIHDLDTLDFSQLDSMADALDMVYYTDQYGVYYNEWYLDTLETEHSPKIYGGMSNNDFILLSKMKDRKKLILTEFNLIASPTPYNVRKKTEKTFGIEWSGWTGRYFDLLDTIKNPELPRWVIRLYTEQHNGDWPFTMSGIVFVHLDERIAILEKKTDLDVEVPFIYTSEYGQKKYKVPGKIHYPYWLDIMYSSQINKVVATYKIKPNDRGDSILKHYGIPSEFPAFIEHDEKDYKFYYFCGDFSDNPITLYSSYFRGISAINRFFYKNTVYNERTKFFWKYYKPIVSKIIINYREERGMTKKNNDSK